MSELQAKMFNKKAANPKNKPGEVLSAIGLKPGQSIADFGSGGGYFSLRFAETVGEKGKVYAVDANREYLDFIRRSAETKGLHNLVLVFLSGSGLNLPDKALDFIFIRNVTHHISDRAAYFKALHKYLKPGGRVAIIEYKRGKTISFRRLFGHHVSEETIGKEMDEAGFFLDKRFDFLPEQHFSIFKLIS
jgi:arsenite methyltransferase